MSTKRSSEILVPPFCDIIQLMKNMMMTSDKGNWLIGGFIYQWQKYCGLPMTIFGFSPPPCELPEHFTFHSLGKFEDYPADKWSNALLEAFDTFEDEQVSIFLEDYYLVRQVPLRIFDFATTFLRMQPDALRFDLTSDRLYCGNIKDVGYFETYDLIEARDSKYQISLQAGVWNKSKLKEIVEPDMSPWDIELQGTTKLIKERKNLRVYGTRQWPVRYQVMVRAGQLELDGSWMLPARQLSPRDLRELQTYGLLSKGVSNADGESVTGS